MRSLLRYLILSLLINIHFSFCSESAQVKEISSSSSFFDRMGYYVPENLFDNNPDTSWVESAPGDGIDEVISIQLDKIITISSITFRNGYGIPEFWLLNNRVKEIEIATENQSYTATLRDIPEDQTISIEKDMKGKHLSFRIKSVYKGTKFSDTALSEIKIAGVKVNPEILKVSPERLETMRTQALKREAISFFRRFNEKQLNEYQDMNYCPKYREAQMRSRETEKYVNIEKVQGNLAIVHSEVIYSWDPCSFFSSMKTLWSFRNGKWHQIQFPVIPHEISLFHLNDDDKWDALLHYKEHMVHPDYFFSIYLNIDRESPKSLFDYRYTSGEKTQDVKFKLGKCEAFGITVTPQYDSPTKTMKFNCKTNSIEGNTNSDL
ncbi:MAG: discoidin domain-containing protein [Leptospiraceae bacterium]|nr:discoidin domain-containing protein [Leptospiraceae bacterium]